LSLPRVLVIGDLLYDVLAEVDGPLNTGTDTFSPVHAQPGGSGANAAAWLAHAGVETLFVARVGDDPLGRMLEEEVGELGAATHLIRDAELPTGKVVVLVDGAGERTMITSRGAGENLHPEDLPGHAFHPNIHLHLSGYLFSEGARRRTALEALRRARRSRMTVSVDPSSTTLLTDLGPQRFLEWTGGADLLFPNHQEGALLAGTKDPERVLDALLDHYPSVVLKLGPDGAAYATRNGERVSIPAASARAVDTTGAGDALCAGVLATWLAGGTPAEALRKGVGLAARCVERVGDRPRA
jgi:sugar/nucleoside kinase (ribokinase family)